MILKNTLFDTISYCMILHCKVYNHITWYCVLWHDTMVYQIILYHVIQYDIMYHIWYNIMQKDMIIIQYYTVPETFYFPIFSYVHRGLTYALRFAPFAITLRSQGVYCLFSVHLSIHFHSELQNERIGICKLEQILDRRTRG